MPARRGVASKHAVTHRPFAALQREVGRTTHRPSPNDYCSDNNRSAGTRKAGRISSRKSSCRRGRSSYGGTQHRRQRPRQQRPHRPLPPRHRSPDIRSRPDIRSPDSLRRALRQRRRPEVLELRPRRHGSHWQRAIFTRLLRGSGLRSACHAVRCGDLDAMSISCQLMHAPPQRCANSTSAHAGRPPQGRRRAQRRRSSLCPAGSTCRERRSASRRASTASE